MKKKDIKCETCEMKGYNADFCRWHKKKLAEVDVKTCDPLDFYKKMGKTAALGAGVGVVAATAGLVAVPAVGLKAVIGHALAAKVTAGGGAAGAGITVARRAKRQVSGSKQIRKRKLLLPLYLRRGGIRRWENQ